MKRYVYGLMITASIMGIGTQSGLALVWPKNISLDQLEKLSETNHIQIDNETITLKSVQLPKRLSKGKQLNSENQKFKEMLPENKHFVSKGKVLGLGESYAIRDGQCVNTPSCQYTFRTWGGSKLGWEPSKFTLELKEAENQKPNRPSAASPIKSEHKAGGSQHQDGETAKFIDEKLQESKHMSSPNGYDGHQPTDRSFKVNQHLITFDILANMFADNRDSIQGFKKNPQKHWTVDLFCEGGRDNISKVYTERNKDIGFGGIILTDLSEDDDKFMSAIYTLYDKNKEPIMEVIFKEKDEGKKNVKTEAGPSESNARELLGLPATGALTQEQISQAFKKKTLESRQNPGLAGSDINKLQAARNVLQKAHGS